MASEIELPDVGEGVAEGEILEWKVEPGDEIETDEVIAEVETDKAVVDIPSPVAGTVVELLADEGDVVSVGAPIARIDTDGDGDADAGSEVEPAAEESAAAAESAPSHGASAGASTGSGADASTGAAQEVQEIELPDVGEGVAEGEILEWKVEPGDEIETDEVIAEVETDKAVVDIPSPVAGTVVELLADEGEVVSVGAPIARVGVGGGAEPVAETATSDASAPEDGDGGDAAKMVFAPPRVRRLAGELGVTVSSVSGSGPGGRVTEDDVREAAAGGADEAAPSGDGAASAVESVEPVASPDSREDVLVVPYARKLATDEGVDIDAVPPTDRHNGQPLVTPESVTQFVESGGEAAAEPESGTTSAEPAGDRPVETVPYRGTRRAIGEHMAESRFTSPHFTTSEEVDVSELVEWREDIKEEAAEQGIDLTYLPFIVKAVTIALKDHPYLNAELDEEAEEITLKKYYNIGVAVATDRGVLVPVIEDADEKTLFEIAEELDDLVEKGRNGDLTVEDMSGGTFTVTSGGPMGGEVSTPIINQPESAILSIGAIKEKPRGVDGEIELRDVVMLSISCDHRIMDGTVGGAFLYDVKKYLSNPKLLLTRS